MLIGVSALVLGLLIAVVDPFQLILKWVSRTILITLLLYLIIKCKILVIQHEHAPCTV